MEKQQAIDMLNSLDNVTIEDIKVEISKLLESYNLKSNYDLDNALDKIYDNLIKTEVEKNNIFHLEKHGFVDKMIKKTQNLVEIKKFIKEYFSKFTAEDRIKECVEGLSLKGTPMTDEEKKHYGIESWYARKHKLGKFMSFEFGNYDCSWGKTGTNYGNSDNIRRLKFLLKELLNVQFDVDLTRVEQSDFGHDQELNNKAKFRIYKNGRLDIKHKDIKKLYNAFKKHSRSSEVFE